MKDVITGILRQMRVGLSWDREDLARAFLSKVGHGAAHAIVIITVINIKMIMIITTILFQVEQLTSRPDNLGLSGPRKAQSGKEEERRRNSLVNKSQISSPCGFRHNVSVRAHTQTQKIVLFKNKQLSKPVHDVISSHHIPGEVGGLGLFALSPTAAASQTRLQPVHGLKPLVIEQRKVMLLQLCC